MHSIRCPHSVAALLALALSAPGCRYTLHQELEAGWVMGPQLGAEVPDSAGPSHGILLNYGISLVPEDVFRQGGVGRGGGAQSSITLSPETGLMPFVSFHGSYWSGYSRLRPEVDAAEDGTEVAPRPRPPVGLQGRASLLLIPVGDFAAPLGGALRGGPYLHLPKRTLSLSAHAQAALSPHQPLQGGVLVGMHGWGWSR